MPNILHFTQNINENRYCPTLRAATITWKIKNEKWIKKQYKSWTFFMPFELNTNVYMFKNLKTQMFIWFLLLFVCTLTICGVYSWWWICIADLYQMIELSIYIVPILDWIDIGIAILLCLGSICEFVFECFFIAREIEKKGPVVTKISKQKSVRIEIKQCMCATILCSINCMCGLHTDLCSVCFGLNCVKVKRYFVLSIGVATFFVVVCLPCAWCEFKILHSYLFKIQNGKSLALWLHYY